MNARDFALLSIDAAHLPGWKRKIRRVRPPNGLGPRERALAEKITVGTIKNLLLLRRLIEHHSGRSLKSIDEIVQKILAIALYQLRFLDRIPASAAVDEAVKQARRFGRSGAAGFVNAVLRNALRDSDPPMSDDLRYSHPRALFRRFESLFGRAAAVALCEHDNGEPPTIVRAFAGHGIDEIAAQAGSSAIVSPHGQPGMFVLEHAKWSALARLAQLGIAQVQDPAAARAACVLGAKPGERVLDRCAGLGTKTFQLREHVGETGFILAVDPNAERCRQLQELARLRGVDANISVANVSWMRQIDPRVIDQPFDRILIDAPCSNSGVLARRPEARYAQHERSLKQLADLQGRILDDTAPHLRPGGRMAYSTCSIWPEENDLVVAAFLSRHDDYRLIEQFSTVPHSGELPADYHDGGYLAILQRD